MGLTLSTVNTPPAMERAQSVRELPTSSLTFSRACSIVWLPGLPETELAAKRVCRRGRAGRWDGCWKRRKPRRAGARVTDRSGRERALMRGTAIMESNLDSGKRWYLYPYV